MLLHCWRHPAAACCHANRQHATLHHTCMQISCLACRTVCRASQLLPVPTAPTCTRCCQALQARLGRGTRCVLRPAQQLRSQEQSPRLPRQRCCHAQSCSVAALVGGPASGWARPSRRVALTGGLLVSPAGLLPFGLATTAAALQHSGSWALDVLHAQVCVTGFEGSYPP